MTAYDDAAEIYLAGGLWPIPIAGKTEPVKLATGYDGTVTFDKVNAWLHSEAKVRAGAGRNSRHHNIGLRHDLTVAIDVDEGYGDKNGVAQLAAFARENDLPPLPATWSSTARGADTGSRQYLYRINDAVRFKTKPCPSVELCCWHHRFTVCAPSVHPDTGSEYAWYLPGAPGVPPSWGELTDRYPRADAFTDLPAEWFEAFRGTQVALNGDAPIVALDELLATFPAGEPDGLVRHLVAEWATKHVGHDEFKNAAINALMLGREGHRGAGQLVDLLHRRYTTYLTTARPDMAASEARNLLNACTTIAQQKPITTPMSADIDDLVDRNETETFLNSATRYTRPDKLGRRTAWLASDGVTATNLLALIEESARGYYPAIHARRALRRVYGQPPGTDPAGADRLFARALGAYLDYKGVAA